MIMEQKELEKKFQSLVEQQHQLRGVVNQSKLREVSRGEWRRVGVGRRVKRRHKGDWNEVLSRA